MKLITENQSEHGQVEWKGKVLTILQEPYLHDVEVGTWNGNRREPRYGALAEDREGNQVFLVWKPHKDWHERNSGDECDWNKFYIKEV